MIVRPGPRPVVWAAVAAVAVAAVVTALVVVANRDDPGSARPGVTTTSTATSATVTSAATTATSGPASTTTAPTTSVSPTRTTPRTTVPAPPTVPAGLAGRDLESIPGAGAVVALTFDAGANADGVAAILATLRREGVPATFFLTGDFAARFAGPSAAIAGAGHRLGNHSVNHPHFTALSDDAIRTQLAGAEQAIRDATGRGARPLFRFPFGDRDQRVIATVNAAGYVPVRWTVDSLGWKGTSGGMTAASVTSRVLGALRPGQIVLMHVGSNPDDRTTLDADALPGIIAGIRAAGYGFVDLDALFG